MPIVQFHLVSSAYDPAAIRTMLIEASYYFAATLYPDVQPVPIERVRAIVHDIAPDAQATGGVMVSEGGIPAPYFTCITLAGRTQEQIESLMTGLSELVARILGIEISHIRGQLIPVEPDHWFIGGIPASRQRQSEIASRDKGRQS